MEIMIAPELYAAIERLARRRGVSIETIIAEAVSLEEVAAEAHDEGARLLVEKDGHVKELVAS